MQFVDVVDVFVTLSPRKWWTTNQVHTRSVLWKQLLSCGIKVSVDLCADFPTECYRNKEICFVHWWAWNYIKCKLFEKFAFLGLINYSQSDTTVYVINQTCLAQNNVCGVATTWLYSSLINCIESHVDHIFINTVSMNAIISLSSCSLSYCDSTLLSKREHDIGINSLDW